MESTWDTPAHPASVAKLQVPDLAWQNIQYSNAHWEGIQTNRLTHPQSQEMENPSHFPRVIQQEIKIRAGWYVSSSEQLGCCSVVVQQKFAHKYKNSQHGFTVQQS